MRRSSACSDAGAARVVGFTASSFLCGLAPSLPFLIVRELMTEHPIVDLREFKNRTYAAGVFLITVLGFILYGSTVLLPLLMQDLLGDSSFDPSGPCPRGTLSRSPGQGPATD